MRVAGGVELVFSPPREGHPVEKDVAKQLSAVARVGNSLFLACDEAAGIERLTRLSPTRYGEHLHIPLARFFDLPDGSRKEVDIEGLAAVDGWLWIVGSHALKRGKAREGEPAGLALSRISELVREENRYLLARLPLAPGPGGIVTPVAELGGRRAGVMRMGGKRAGLARWLAKDGLIAPFLDLPGKENGLDIEGITARGPRIWLGLRGPVIGAHAVVLELEVEEGKRGRLKPGRDAAGRRYRRHLLDTGGLGIRDLRLDGDDLLLLVGPTMALRGTARVLRWPGAVAEREEGLVPEEELETVAELPYGRETDHPEALDLWPEAGPDALLVIDDAPGQDRLSDGGFTLRADVLRAAATPPG